MHPNLARLANLSPRGRVQNRSGALVFNEFSHSTLVGQLLFGGGNVCVWTLF